MKSSKLNSKGKKYSSDNQHKHQESSAFTKQNKRTEKPHFKTPFKKKPSKIAEDDGQIRLNKYIAHAGLASRREADDLIKTGVVTVNGKVVDELGYKVQQHDEVRFDGKLIKAEKKIYVLLNKPKGFITTMQDEKARKTVMELVANASPYRIYPVGRLDRQTTGVLLFTNDGDLAKKLTHPKHQIKKIYSVSLNKPLELNDFHTIQKGIALEEGTAIVDKISYVEGKGKTELGIEIHIGWNRVVRRIFESLGYEVMKLDRVYFAGLTKKGISRGQWKILTEKEVNYLKML